MMTNIAGPAAGEALTKLAADLYKRFFQARIAEKHVSAQCSQCESASSAVKILFACRVPGLR